MKHLFECLKKYKFQSVLAPLLKCLEACFDLAVPLIVADIIDKGIGEGNKSYIVNRFFLLLAMAALGLASCIVAQFFAAKVAVDTSADLRHNLLSKIQSLSLNELDSVTSSTLITRMTSDINQVQNGLNMFLRLFMRSPFIVFGAMILAFTINAKLALIFVGAIALLFVIVFGMRRFIKAFSKTSTVLRKLQTKTLTVSALSAPSPARRSKRKSLKSKTAFCSLLR